jgi:hypothetical protein
MASRTERDRAEVYALRAIVIELLRLRSSDPQLIKALREAIKQAPLVPASEQTLVRRELVQAHCERLLDEADPFLPPR